MAITRTKKAACPFCDNNHSLSDGCPALGNLRVFDGSDSLFVSKEPRPLTSDNMSTWQKFLHYTGKVFAGIMAIGCGVSTAAAFLMLGFMSAGTGSFLIAGCIFLATALTNWYIFKTAVPEVMISLLGRKWSEDLFAIRGGCDLIHTDQVDFDPKKLTLISKSAYIRHNNQLIYFNKKTGKQVVVLDGKNAADVATLKKFDAAMKIGTGKNGELKYNRAVKLSHKGIKAIQDITGHSLISKTKMANMVVGGLLALSVGITFGALTYTSTFSLTAAFGFLAAISSAFPPIAAVLAAVTLVCLSTLMLTDIIELIKTENALQSCWNFLKNMVHTGTRATVLTMDVKPTPESLEDVEFNTLYVKVKNELYFVNKETNTIVLLQDTGVTPLNPAHIKGIDWDALSNKELTYEQLALITQKTKQPHKSWLQVVFERGLIALLTIAFIPLAILGLFMTQNSCAPGVKAFLMDYIPRASAAAVSICSDIICLGLALLGQIPFTIATSVRTIMSLFNTDTILGSCNPTIKHSIQKLNEKNKAQKLSIVESLQLGALYTLAVINAIGNGFISMVGGAVSLVVQVFSGIGGWWNSASAGLSAVRNAFRGAKEEIQLSLYKAQEDRHFWRTVGMVAAAFILTPLTLLLTYSRWKEARTNDSNIVRLEMSTAKYDAIRQNKKEAFVEYQASTPATLKLVDRAKPVEKPKKVVIDSADYKTKIIYMDKHQATRFLLFDNKQKLTDEQVKALNQSVDGSRTLLAAAPA